jgi:hypothetical protein
MKKTLFCMHVMPHEIESFERFMIQYHRALAYLDGNDDITLKVTLNLNPELTDWEASEYKQGYFVSRFAVLFSGIKNINEIILDNSMWGTTQQKRESIKLPYDQFIFCDADIVLHEHLLKYQLNVSYQLDGMYIASPSIPRWWDASWDSIVDSNLLNKFLGYAHTLESIESVFKQDTSKITVKQTQKVKFGCGMHTLYSKSFWEFVGIPESFGGYGPEDTYAMNCADVAEKYGVKITQVVLDGIYITEDDRNKTPSFDGKIVRIDKKREFYDKAFGLGQQEVINFAKSLIEKQSNT